MLAAIGAVAAIAVAVYLSLREDEGDWYGWGYYDRDRPRHRDPEIVLIEDGFLVEEPGLIEPQRTGTLGVSAGQQTRKGS
jgi:hypothetical protein